jgi:sterol-4alpha-carboxylate 3-dehydrogenase (decarboxylating)
VENLVLAHLLAADKLVPDLGVAGEIFFITNDNPVSFWDFPQMVWSRLAAAGTQPIPTKMFLIPKFLGMIMAYIMEYIAYFFGKEPTFTRFRVRYCWVKRWHNIEKARIVLVRS